jgi:hypothetical protein
MTSVIRRIVMKIIDRQKAALDEFTQLVAEPTGCPDRSQSGHDAPTRGFLLSEAEVLDIWRIPPTDRQPLQTADIRSKGLGSHYQGSLITISLLIDR